ncbi:hypothetical protein [Paenibacillus gansuensis]|uniref:Uncharacterized protein n=1 Tax=Paenibacillus gansuensis TaxID=306542 RepID=A0ABW5PBJ3_9BACL
MSEFSESYHLFSDRQEEGVELLTRAKLKGYVYPAQNHWVTILAEGSMFQENKQLVRNNLGTLVHYIFAEDHGWTLSIYERAEQVFHYDCVWEEEVDSNYGEFNLNKVVDVINANPVQNAKVTLEELQPLFHITEFEQAFELSPAYRVAELLGMPYYEWLSYEYVKSDMADGDSSNIVEGLVAV